jgi:hypothetical protein
LQLVRDCSKEEVLVLGRQELLAGLDEGFCFGNADGMDLGLCISWSDFLISGTFPFYYLRLLDATTNPGARQKTFRTRQKLLRVTS